MWYWSHEVLAAVFADVYAWLLTKELLGKSPVVYYFFTAYWLSYQSFGDQSMTVPVSCSQNTCFSTYELVLCSLIPFPSDKYNLGSWSIGKRATTQGYNPYSYMVVINGYSRQ